MAKEGNTNWAALRRELPVDAARVAFFTRVIELQLELAWRLERRGLDGQLVTAVLEADNDRLERQLAAGDEIDVVALGEELAKRAGARPPQ